MSNGDLKTESLDEHRSRINDAIRVKKKSTVVISEPPKPINTDDKTKIPDTSASEVNPPKPAEPKVPQPVTAAKPDVSHPQGKPMESDKKGEVDYEEWARKKGITNREDAIRLLRQKDIEFHERNQKKQEDNVPRGTPLPQWQPTPEIPPVWIPSTQPAYSPVNRKQVVEQYAAQFNMLPEDFEKVLQVADEVSEIKMRNLLSQIRGEIGEVKRETARNTEIRNLEQDPLFSNSEVQFEMHRILEENPSAFRLEPAPYRWAFNEAQRTIARRYLEKRNKEVTPGYPTMNPPATAGGGNGSGSATAFESPETTLNKFSKSSLEEKQKMLTSLGARPTL